MSQQQIIDILEKRGAMFATQIIEELRIENEPKTFVRNVLKQMRRYGDVNFIQIAVMPQARTTFKVRINNKPIKWKVVKKEELFKQFPGIEGRIITRPCYLYYL